MNKIQTNSSTVTSQEIHAMSQRLNNRVTQVVTEIAEDNINRMNKYKEDKNQLNAGCFYPNEYFQALKEMGFQDRLEFFLKKGSFFHGYVSPKHFTMIKCTDSPSGFKCHCFFLKQGVTPSDGIDAIRKGISLIGCGEICQIACYEAIRSELGDEKFNAMFALNSKTPLVISWAYANPLTCLLTQTKDPIDCFEGEVLHFQNSEHYQKKHTNGDAKGFNVICCKSTIGEPVFTGLGVLNQTVNKMNEKMLNALNEKPVGFSIMTEEMATRQRKGICANNLQITEKLVDYQMDEDTFLGTGGGVITVKHTLNVDRISELAQLPIKDAVAKFTSWCWSGK